MLLVTANWSETIGHGIRCLAVAEKLLEEGHEVALLAPESYREWTLPGMTFRAAVPRGADLSAKAVFFGFHTYEDVLYASGYVEEAQIRQTVEREMDMIEAFRPDIVLGDSQFTLGISAPLKGVPYLTMATWPMHPAFNRAVEAELPIRNTLLKRIRMVWNRVLRGYGLPEIGHVSELLFDRAGLVAAPTSRLLEPELADHCADAVYVGRVAPVSRFGETPAWLREWDRAGEDCNGQDGAEGGEKAFGGGPADGESGEKSGKRLGSQQDNAARESGPIVYVYLSSLSVGVNRADTFRAIYEAFEPTDCRVVFGLGKFNADSAGFRPPADRPDRIRFEAFVPGEAMMKRADLAIFPGTHSVMTSAVASGVPCLVLPDLFERAYNAECLGRLGLGEIFDAGEVRASVIREAAMRLLAQRRSPAAGVEAAGREPSPAKPEEASAAAARIGGVESPEAASAARTGGPASLEAAASAQSGGSASPEDAASAQPGSPATPKDDAAVRALMREFAANDGAARLVAIMKEHLAGRSETSAAQRV